MAIGSTINYSVPTVGTTVGTLAKAAAGEFTLLVEAGDVDVPIVVKLRRSSLGSIQRRFGATWKFRPSQLDAGGTQTKGDVSVAINVDSHLGTTVTREALVATVKHAMSVLLHASLVDNLVDGMLE